MLLLLFACAPEPAAPGSDAGHCEGGAIAPIDPYRLGAAIPEDAVASSGTARAGCLPSRAYKWELTRPVDVRGIPCSDHVYLGDDRTRVASCILAEDACVEGLPLRGGQPVRWVPSHGQLRSGTLATPATVEGVACDAGSFELTGGDGRGYCRVAPGTRVDGIACEGVARFDGTGAVVSCRLHGDVAIPAEKRPVGVDAALVCRGSAQFEDGRLSACTLAAPARLSGLDVPAGAGVRWEEGALELGRRRTTGRRADEEVPGCEWPHMAWDDGSVAICTRTTPTEAHGYPVPVGSSVETDPWGHVTEVDFAGSLRVDGVPCTGEVRFHPDGTLAACRLAGDYTTPSGQVGRTRAWLHRAEDGTQTIGRR